MSLVPVGKRRFMVAQAVPGPAHEMAGEIDTGNIKPGQAQMSDQPNPEEVDGAAAPDPASVEEADPSLELEQKVDQAEQQQQGAPVAEGSPEKDGDVRQTVFDFLVGLGYPPRRLQEFKSQFVSETGSANSGTTVAIVIPDEVYGKNTQIPREKMKQFVQIMEKKHGLSFQDYKRANEQLTFNFMTADAAAQQSMMDAGPGDILDKVYGKPGGKGAKGKPPAGGGGAKMAQSFAEMRKEAKDNQIAMLLKILSGDKK
jgi:hypothetical protein